MDNTTSAVINSLKFDVAKQVRSMIIILAGFNVAMAFVLAVIIFRNGYKATQKSDPAFGFRSSFIRYIEISEVFPFVLSIGIIIQGIIYAASQIKGLDGLLILGCTSISQAMFPALFVVPFVQLVFGLESTVQALRRKPFQQRPRWVTVGCLLIVIIGTLLLYVQTRVMRPPDLCYASLFWFVQTWRLEAFALLTIIGCALVIGAIVVFVRLHRDTSIGIIERTAASKMVYYMILGAVLNGLMAPFFFSISAQNPLALASIQLNLNMVGSVASNVSGITFGVLYLFLRSRKMQKIGPLGHVELGSHRREKSMESWHGSQIFNTQIEQPVSPVNVFESRRSMSIFGSKIRKSDSSAAAHIKSPSSGDDADDSNWPLVSPTQVVTRPRKNSYSLFPNQQGALESKPKGATILPSTTYTPDTPMVDKDRMSLINEMFEELLPPPTIRVSGAPRHNRESSLVSSATVQIGLRVSNLEDAAPSSSSDVAQTEQFPSAASSRRSSVATSVGRRESTTVEVRSEEQPMTLAPAVYSPGKAITSHEKDRRSMDSTPSTAGAQSTDGKYSVGTADWI
ncbi:hypothetical protein BBK36DRAFT_1183782 [Trichoderma citrinoviride]|uniref:Uncharacterized protein n=1 Tax=Trichoderma citrinoviride TaxID=58853 RepID=A0A2T4B0M6_9HYPO|nr:hypothetical protein BBK36DRAFT_1183782 [Trichoderma citrinoviride]PTB62877.1 hypothetical protein BBK36DRAFT_1183782 [Trichoderma citrinoviride]